MKVALTGATGFIGSHVLTDLDKHGHEVMALVRNDDQADSVATRGAAPVGRRSLRPTGGLADALQCRRCHPYSQSR